MRATVTFNKEKKKKKKKKKKKDILHAHIRDAIPCLVAIKEALNVAQASNKVHLMDDYVKTSVERSMGKYA